MTNNTQTETNYFLHRDIQGTILALSSVSGDLEEKRLYDAWGNIKLVVHKDGSINKLLGIIDRGYTGHEHLQSIGLIHMNGRLYDPILRRFISPDNFVQDPYNTQNFDRYAYVYNNPLSYTDPDGEFIVGVLVGVAVGVTTNAIMNAIQGIPLWYGMGKAITISAISAGVSFGIGSIATEIGNTSFRVAFQAGAHATSGGIFSSIDGGNFLSGFTSGAISSLAGSGIDGLKIESDSFSDALIIASGGLTGGISSTIAGGSFWKGIRQGLITTGLNHVQHKFVNSFLDNGYEKDGKGGYRRVNNKGGDDTDYLYEKGRIIQSKEVSASPHELTQRTYGIKAGSPNLIEVDIVGTLLGGRAVLMGFYQLGKVGLLIFKTPIAAKGGANLSTNGIKLAKQLASDAQMAEKGLTIIGSGKLREAARLAKQYGGKANDWVKKSSSSFTKNGTTFETHWYENISTGLRTEFKTKFP